MPEARPTLRVFHATLALLLLGAAAAEAQMPRYGHCVINVGLDNAPGSKTFFSGPIHYAPDGGRFEGPSAMARAIESGFVDAVAQRHGDRGHTWCGNHSATEADAVARIRADSTRTAQSSPRHRRTIIMTGWTIDTGGAGGSAGAQQGSAAPAQRGGVVVGTSGTANKAAARPDGADAAGSGAAETAGGGMRGQGISTASGGERLAAIVGSSAYDPQAAPRMQNRYQWAQSGCRVTYTSTASRDGDVATVEMRFSLGDMAGVSVTPGERGGYEVEFSARGGAKLIDADVQAVSSGRRIGPMPTTFSAAKFMLRDQAQAEEAGEVIRGMISSCR